MSRISLPYLFTTFGLGVAFIGLPGFCSDTNQCVSVLGSQSGHLFVDDPSVQKAIEMLIKQPPKAREGKTSPNKQDNPIGSQPANMPSGKVLILGGPEVVPM